MLQEDATAREARVFSDYLLGTRPAPELIERYRLANEKLAGELARTDAALIDFALHHPRSLPFLDAAAGLLRPASRLRRKLVVLTAILETDPAHAARFEPAACSPAAAIAWCALLGLGAVAKAAVGIPLYLAVTRKR